MLALEGKRPVISWAGGTTFTFKVAFNDTDNVGGVYVVSTKNGEKRRLEATWDENKQAYVAAGFTGYVPGYISVEYEDGNGEFKNASSVVETVFEEAGVIGNESKVTMDDGTEFYYSMEQMEDITELPEEGLDKVDIEGRTCYLSREKKYMTKGNKAYAYQDLYLMQPNGKYTLLRTGIGLPGSEGLEIAIQTFKEESDPGKDTFDEVSAFVDFLADTSESDDTSESVVYVTLEQTLNSLQSAFESTDKEYWELDQLKTKLKLVKLTESTQGVYNKVNKIIQYSAKYNSDPDVLKGDKIAERMEETVKAMKKASKGIENRQMRSIMEELCKKGWFQESLMEKALKKLSDEKNSSCGFNPKFAIDPSGYVYEAVTNNRIEGVKATIYYKASSDAEAVLWDAEEYDQSNPLHTDKLGAYAWDVPEGYWQVKYEKEGYDTAYSEWLPVPPPQIDINVGLVSKEKPVIENVAIYPDYAKIVFSKYMNPESMTGLRLEEDNGESIPYLLEYDDSQVNLAGENYAKEFIIRYTDGTILEKGTTCKFILDGKATSYAGIAADAVEQEKEVENRMEIVAPDSVTVKMGETVEIPVRILNAEGIKNMEVVSGFDEIAIVEMTEEGNVKVTGQLYGETELNLSIPGTGINKIIKIIVGKKSLEIETNPTVSIRGSIASVDRDSGITVQLVDKNGGIAAETEIKGEATEYTLDDVAVGSYTIRVSKADHVERSYPITVTGDGDTVQNIEIWLIGDVNGDGKVNAKDKKILYNHIAGSSLLTDYVFSVGDVNGDGRINAKDKKVVYNHIAGTVLLWN